MVSGVRLQVSADIRKQKLEIVIEYSILNTLFRLFLIRWEVRILKPDT